MLNDLQGFLGLLIAVVAIGAAAGVGFQRGKIGKLRGELAEADARANRLASDLGETRTDLTDAQGKIETLSADLDSLGRVVTGEAHWTAISGQLEDHDLAAREHWRQQLALLTIIANSAEGTPDDST